MGLAILFLLMYLYGDITGEAAFGWWFFAFVMSIFFGGSSNENHSIKDTSEDRDPEDFWLGEK